MMITLIGFSGGANAKLIKRTILKLPKINLEYLETSSSEIQHEVLTLFDAFDDTSSLDTKIDIINELNNYNELLNFEKVIPTDNCRSM